MAARFTRRRCSRSFTDRRGAYTLLELMVAAGIGLGVVALAGALLISYARLARDVSIREQIDSRAPRALRALEASLKTASAVAVEADGKSLLIDQPDGSAEFWSIENATLVRGVPGSGESTLMVRRVAATSFFRLSGPEHPGGFPSLAIALRLAESEPDGEEPFGAVMLETSVALRNAAGAAAAEE